MLIEHKVTMSKKFLAIATSAALAVIVIVLASLIPPKDICADDVRDTKAPHRRPSMRLEKI